MTKVQPDQIAPPAMSLETIIATLVAVGLPGKSVWAVLEQKYPAIIAADDPRRDSHSRRILPAYDAKERERIAQSMESVQRLMLPDHCR